MSGSEPLRAGKIEEERWSEGDERGEEDGRCGNIDERQWLGKKKKTTKCEKDRRDVGLDWQKEEEYCILEEGGKQARANSEIRRNK